MKNTHCHSKEHAAKKIDILDNPKRREALPPEKIFNRIPIKKTDTILDVGAGTGFLTIPVATLVEEGVVYALDADPHMIEIIHAKAHNEKINNIQTIKGTVEHMPLSEGSVDIVLASLVLHEIQPLPKVLQKIKHVLKQNGYFVCIEIESEETPESGPHRIPSETMEQQLIQAGFHVKEKIKPTDTLYIMIAQNI
ncbi:class I SAM-dependent methyltransferase [Bacillus sp. 1P06AnD]|uniref:class I SAM-dependent methyltransferase n=1 Tax=Bacillus sp. 1P06AnD TaxID=3132208 RepID=UPI0039A011A9